jgi:hypothetical protein
MAELFSLPPPRGSWVATIEIVRVGQGQFAAHLIDMPADVIDAMPGSPAHKLRTLSGWLMKGAQSLIDQALMIEEPLPEHANKPVGCPLRTWRPGDSRARACAAEPCLGCFRRGAMGKTANVDPPATPT